jgi:MoaA/NifB/PqqE/SkfB family radical SAM enzyme
MNNSSFLLSSTFVTRKCPMHCKYCRIRESKLKSELTLKEWKEAYSIMEKLKIPFNLILGNEPLMLQDDLVELVRFFRAKYIKYGMYTTFPEPLFSKYKIKLLRAGLKNLSCGIDVNPDSIDKNDITTKSLRGLEGLKWGKKMGIPELHATVTISKLNLSVYPEIVDLLTSLGIWTEVNVIHYDKDGKFDFFPPKNKMKDLILTKEDFPELVRTSEIMKKKVLEGKVMVHNVPEYFNDLIKFGLNLDWHCKLPVVLAVDADGSLRVCSYRVGNRVKKYSIFDLPESMESFISDWKKDSDDCPGCYWSCWYHAEYYYNKNPDFGKKYFQTHKSEYWRRG